MVTGGNTMKHYLINLVKLIGEDAPIGFNDSIHNIKGWTTIGLKYTTVIINDEPTLEILIYDGIVGESDILFWQAGPIEHIISETVAIYTRVYRRMTIL